MSGLKLHISKGDLGDRTFCRFEKFNFSGTYSYGSEPSEDELWRPSVSGSGVKRKALGVEGDS